MRCEKEMKIEWENLRPRDRTLNAGHACVHRRKANYEIPDQPPHDVSSLHINFLIWGYSKIGAQNAPVADGHAYPHSSKNRAKHTPKSVRDHGCIDENSNGLKNSSIFPYICAFVKDLKVIK